MPVSMLSTYISTVEQAFLNSLVGATGARQCRELQTTRDVLLWEADISHKYLLRPSALSIISQLQPHVETLKTVPDISIWLVLEDEEGHNVSFSSLPRTTQEYLKYHQETPYSNALAAVTKLTWLWEVDILSAAQPVERSYLYHCDLKQWTLHTLHTCPTRQCQQVQGEHHPAFPKWSICEQCLPDFCYWTTWITAAWMVASGEFAQLKEAGDLKRQEQRIVQWMDDIGQLHKEAQVVTHIYKIIEFD